MQKLASNALINAIIQQESGGNPNAVSPVGAQGLMQVMPQTAKNPGFGIAPLSNAFDPVENKRFGTDYVNAMLKRYNGDKEAALIAYNAGPGNADKFIKSGRDYSVLPKRQETEPYVQKILSSLGGNRPMGALSGVLAQGQGNPQALPVAQQMAYADMEDPMSQAPFAPVPTGVLNPMIAAQAQGQGQPTEQAAQTQGPGFLQRNSDYLINLGAGLLANAHKGFGPSLGTAIQQAQQAEKMSENEKVKRQIMQMKLKAMSSKDGRTTAQKNIDYLKSLSKEDPERAMAERVIMGNTGPEFAKKGIEALDKDGNPILLQLNNRGEAIVTKLPDNVTLTKNKVTGNSLINQRTGEVVKDLSPQIQGGEESKVLGKKAGEVKAEEPQVVARAESTFNKADTVIDMAKLLSRHPGLPGATGPIDSRLPTVTTNVANFETEIDTLKTKVFVSAIQEMRELSKTGGALGSVTEREIEKMENSMRNLSLRQGDKNLAQNLLKLANDFEDSKDRIRNAYIRQYGRSDNMPDFLKGGASQQASASPEAQAAPQAPASPVQAPANNDPLGLFNGNN